MLIQRFTPTLQLLPYIEGIHVQEDWHPANFANRNPVKVLPSSMTVIGIQYGQPMRIVENNTEISMGSSGITGIHAKVKEYVSTGAIGTIIIPFKPGRLARFTSIPIHEFQNMDVPLELIFPGPNVREMEEKLAGAASAAERVGIVEQFLLSVWRDREDEQMILLAAKQIMNRQGNLSIEQLAAQFYVSRRTLERKFNQLIGASPKQFASVIRFQHTIQLRNAGFDYLDIVQACGYADQAHFAKDFKSFAGLRPEQFFRSEIQPELKQSFNENDDDSRPNQQLYF
ncbi:AraC-like DNA-binding protein [Paenibacillus phyllosphaerae]|uniref:AraC-like DNA-binding protein n=1 Tax=Paenibacillus phyllosphaerae TaxID=274593 RepID=A0A7W5B533_9BACL|nr:helix-turn-helix domain-containing protein [Paenibacillus phyllosphaerae]MBB3114570.1 AraC-like DNA-binding protein [Paenibacillus phyllosphaerae]